MVISEEGIILKKKKEKAEIETTEVAKDNLEALKDHLPTSQLLRVDALVTVEEDSKLKQECKAVGYAKNT